MKKIVQQLSVCAVCAMSAGLAWSQDSGLYLGGSIGSGRLDNGGSTLDGAFANQGLTTSSSVGKSATAFTLILGQRLSQNLSFEASYLDLGQHNYSSAVYAPGSDQLSGSFRSQGLGLSFVGIAPLSNGLSVYGKLGGTWLRTQLDSSSGGIVNVNDQSHTGLGWTFGLGASYALTSNVDADLEWNRYLDVGASSTTGNEHVDIFSLGARYHF